MKHEPSNQCRSLFLYQLINWNQFEAVLRSRMCFHRRVVWLRRINWDFTCNHHLQRRIVRRHGIAIINAMGKLSSKVHRVLIEAFSININDLNRWHHRLHTFQLLTINLLENILLRMTLWDRKCLFYWTRRWAQKPQREVMGKRLGKRCLFRPMFRIKSILGPSAIVVSCRRKWKLSWGICRWAFYFRTCKVPLKAFWSLALTEKENNVESQSDSSCLTLFCCWQFI